MQVWRTLDDVPGGLGRTVAVIGNFDGLHRGHQQVIQIARRRADASGWPLVAVTFEPHPMAVLRPEHAPIMLTTIEYRAGLLAREGVDHVLALPFDADMATWSPVEFVDRVLVDAVRVGLVVVGANFRFGYRAAGDVATLRSLGAERGFEVLGVDLAGGPMVWSSTYVRTCLAAGDVEGAEEATGRPVSVDGVVMRGEQRGRQLGFPTANVSPSRVAAPADGIYAGWLVRLDTGERFPAAISVGTNPTFSGERERRVEAYVLDRDDLELYDAPVVVEFIDRIRGQIRFDSIDGLIVQMADDVERTRRVLGLS